MNIAVASEPREIVVVAGLDREQVEAAFTLHQALAIEQGKTLDATVWASEVSALIAAGAYNLGVAWSGERPVGVVEMILEHEALGNQTVAWGRRGYVLPEFRREDVFKAIFDCGVAYAQFSGVTVCRAVCDNDWYGKAMQRFYESRGFEVIGIIMEKS